MEKRLAEHRANFKKNFDDPRRKREDLQVQIRKAHREQNLAKKRAEALGQAEAAAAGAGIDVGGGSIPGAAGGAGLGSSGLSTGLPGELAQGQQAAAAGAPAAAASSASVDFSRIDLQQLMQQLASGDPTLELQATQLFRRALSIEYNPPIQQVIDAGAVPHFVRFLSLADREQLQFEAAWALTNIASGTQEQTKVLTDACWALSYLSDGPNDRIEAVLEAGVCNRLVDLLEHPSTLVQTPALRAVGNIVTGDDRQTQVVITCGAVPKLLSLLSSSRKTVQKEACWTISNITAGNREQIQEVLNGGVIPALLHVLETAEFDTKKEAAWALSNAVSGGSDAQIDALVRLGCIPPLCELIGCADPKIVLVCLEALQAILRVGKKIKEAEGLPSNPFADLVDQADGTSALEKLQDTTHEAIFKKVYSIISTYFPYVEEDEAVAAEMGAPGAPGDGSTFGVEAPQGGFNFA